MENEKIETNAENNINQQNSNSEVKPRNKNCFGISNYRAVDCNRCMCRIMVCRGYN